MSFLRKLLGRTGEGRAERYLVQQGYRILERNFRTRQGEIDLIALDGGELVFVEVKTRTSDAFGAPELAVDPRKQARIARAALGYLRRKNLHQLPCRFDVVAVRAGGAGDEVQLIRHAFVIDEAMR